MSKRRQGRRAGFSLIELMVGVALVGIVAGLVVPNVSQAIGRQQALNSEKKAPDFVQRARGFARTTRCETILSVSNSNGIYTLSYSTTETDTNLPCGQLNGEALSFREGITFSDWTSVVITGATSGGGGGGNGNGGGGNGGGGGGGGGGGTATLTTLNDGMVFNERGGTDYGGEARLTVTNNFGSGRTIKVWPFIGNVEVVF